MALVVNRATALGLVAALAFAACEARAPAPDVGSAPSPDGGIVDGAASDTGGAASDASDGAIVDASSGDASSAGTCNGVALPKSVASLGCPEEGYLRERPAGFSRDGAFVGVCVSACDPCPLACTVHGRSGATKHFSDYYAPESAETQALERLPPSPAIERRIAAIEEAKHAAFEKSLGALGLAKGPPGRPLAGPFPYEDLALVTAGEVSATTGRATLSFGARVDGEEPVYPIRIVLPPTPMWNAPLPLDRAAMAKLDPVERKEETDRLRAEMREQFALSEPVLVYADVTRDGAEIAAVAMVTSSMWYEDGAAARMATKTFVAKVYEETAERRAKRGDRAGAAALREKARVTGGRGS